jgi:hypothetical protein
MPKLTKNLSYYSDHLGCIIIVPKGCEVSGHVEDKARECGALPEKRRNKAVDNPR